MTSGLTNSSTIGATITAPTIIAVVSISDSLEVPYNIPSMNTVPIVLSIIARNIPERPPQTNAVQRVSQGSTSSSSAFLIDFR